jgi:hypothetical protein
MTNAKEVPHGELRTDGSIEVTYFSVQSLNIGPAAAPEPVHGYRADFGGLTQTVNRPSKAGRSRR